MSKVEVKKIKSHTINVVHASDQKGFISHNDAEMDARAKQAVKVVVEKAKFCNKPVAKYDMDTKRAYVEYADGVKVYVN